MTNLDELLAQEAPPARETKKPELPKGWEPGIAWDGNDGAITTGPLKDAPDSSLWKQLIADWDLDPDTVEIIGPIRVKGWDSPVKGTTTGETIRLKSYSVNIQRQNRTYNGTDLIDVEHLCKLALSRKKIPKPADLTTLTGRALVVGLGDFQMGKGEGGGSEATVKRVVKAMADVVAHIKELRKLKRLPGAIYVMTLGDLGEGCANNYESQGFTVDLNRREQTRVVRRLIWRFIDDLVVFGIPIVLTAVPGNHGEHRNGSNRMFTTLDDNDDLAVVEQVAEIMAANPDRYALVSTVIADDYTLTLDVAGVPLCTYHGHVGKGSIAKWWEGMIIGNRPGVKDAQILLTGHYHHLTVTEANGRTHVQTPAMDGGSHSFSSATGKSAPAGMLTIMVGTDFGPRGWDELRIF
jgi:predicted phosphodiesterase